MASVTHPTGDTVAWAGTTIDYAKVGSTEYGIPAGHWRQTVSRGDYRKIIYFDALWRPVIEREYDNAAATATQRFRGWKYDHEGRVAFEGYPLASATGIASFTTGTTTTYDPLGRPLSVSRSTELGAPAVTTYAYLPDFVTRVQAPNGAGGSTHYTDTRFQAFDQPSTEVPVQIVAAVGQPEQQTTDIVRNLLGNPATLLRSGTYGGAGVSAARHYVYDVNQRLCKRVEPETGATLVAYDGAQNIAWSTEGSTLTGLTCDRDSVPTTERTTRVYDDRSRLTLVNFPDSTSDIATSYYPDGAVASVTTGQVTIEYTYNKRRLLASERLLYDSLDWLTQYGYSTLGDRASLVYRDGHSVSFAPNALGQATQAGIYATGVSYFPNGALKQFTYGNGVVHTLTQNARQLPLRSRDAFGATAILDDQYTYDANGNVLGINDQTAANEGDRLMTYDALDRLLTVHAGPAQGGDALFAYDPLDNLRIANQGARQFVYHYNANGQLATLKSPGGTTLHSFSYDPRGNQTSKSGAGGSTYNFDRANRMLTATAGTSSYVYDGLGRRVREVSGGASTYFQYSREGQLLYTNDLKVGLRYNHVYLAGSLVARRTVPASGGAATVAYQHTDALGTPIAQTDENGALIGSPKRNTAYGEPADGQFVNGLGYTGHQTDQATKLIYMQQRYYDPAIGRFLSVDPMQSDMTTGWNFNRYNYAANNPYRFTDPDGREIELAQGAPADFLRNAAVAIRYLNAHGLAGAVGYVKNHKGVVTLAPAADRTDVYQNRYDPNTNTLYWADQGTLELTDPQTGDVANRSPALVLGHEFEHAANHLGDPKGFVSDIYTPDAVYGNAEEAKVIEEYENPAARKLGEPTRNSHQNSGKPVVTKCVTENCP